MFSFFVLIAIIIATIYVAIMYVSTSIMLLVYMETVLFAVSFLVLIYRRFTVKGDIQIPIAISEVGKENTVRIMITNRSRFSILKMKALVVVEDTIRGTKKSFWMKLSEAFYGENTFIQSVIFPGSGNYEISLKKLRIYDWTGLMYGHVRVKKTSRVQVMPEIRQIPVALTAITKNFYGEAEVYDENMPGHDNSEIFQVREYQKGDRIQNVHWKLTAKQDEIIVKEHSLPKSCPVVLFLDFRKDKHKSKNKRASVYMEVVVSLSFSLMDAACAHYVVWCDSEENDIVRLRVDDEESFFYFIGRLMKVRWQKSKENLVERYKEKYRMDPYVWGLTLDEKLVLKKGEEIIAQYSEKNLEKSLSRTEVVL